MELARRELELTKVQTRQRDEAAKVAREKVAAALATVLFLTQQAEDKARREQEAANRRARALGKNPPPCTIL
jgi:hypothetical protein